MLHISRRNVFFDLQLIVLTFARVMTRIFTATLLLCWLLVMVLVAPPEFQAAMTLSIGPITFNVLYILPTLIIIVHLAQRRMDSRRVVCSANAHRLAHCCIPRLDAGDHPIQPYATCRNPRSRLVDLQRVCCLLLDS